MAPPIRQRDEVPPTLPASSGQLRVVHHALDDDDTDTLLSENSRRGVVVSQHESDNRKSSIVGWCGCASHVCEAVCGHAERAKIFAGSIPQCRARGSG